MTPDGHAGWVPSRARVDGSLINALARAHRWQRMLDDARYGSVSELTAAEKLDRGYLGRILMLTLLAPDIVEAITDGRQPAGIGVHVLREGFPMEWGSNATNVRPLQHTPDDSPASSLSARALSTEVPGWSTTTLRDRLVKIGAKIVRHGRSITFQMAEVMVPRTLFQQTLDVIAALRPLPPARY